MSVKSGGLALALALAITAAPSTLAAAAMPAEAAPSAVTEVFVLDPEPGDTTPNENFTPSENAISTNNSTAPAVVADWFANRAAAVLNSEGIDVFPKLDAAKIRELSVGAPIQSVNFVAGVVSEQNALTPGQRWVAPILDGNQVVGAISADYVNGTISNEEVAADIRLGTEAMQTSDTVLIFDPTLKAWFALRDQAIEPADSAGSSIVLGAVPLKDFLTQRARILSEDNGISKVVGDESGSSTGVAVSLPTVLIIFFSLVMLVTLSLVWLRWDSKADQRAAERGEETDKKREKSDEHRKPRLTEIAEKVRVFERPESASEVIDTAERQLPGLGGEEQ